MEYTEAFNIALNTYFEPQEEPEMDHLPDYKIVDFGIDHTQYFPGICSDDVYAGAVYGIGMTYSEALDDALEMLIQQYDFEKASYLLVDEIERLELVDGIDDLRARVSSDDHEEIYYHVGILFNLGD